MAVRETMVELINELRAITAASEEDATIGGVTYWTDQQLQDELDKQASNLVNQPITATPFRINGTVSYTDYYFPTNMIGRFEPALELYDHTGTLVTAGYEIDYSRKLVQFETSTNNHLYYLRGRSYNINLAAAQVWLKKAGFRAEMIQWKVGLHSMREDQEWEHCMRMYEHYNGSGGLKSSRLMRVDYGPGFF